MDFSNNVLYESLDEKTALRRPNTIARLGRVGWGLSCSTHIVARVYRTELLMSTILSQIYSQAKNSKTARNHKGFLTVFVV